MTNYAKTFSAKLRARTKVSLRLILVASVAILMARVGAAQSYQTIYSFQGSPDGADPMAAVIIGKNGALYGTTYEGGTSKAGTAFVLVKPTGEPWKERVLYSFGSDGNNPRVPLVLGSTGALYGTLIGGGGQYSSGVIFELTRPSTAGSAWTQTTLYTVPGPGNAIPNGPLLFGPGGTIYTTTEGPPASQAGEVIALAPPTTPGGAWTESLLFAFDGDSGGAAPMAGVVSEGGSLFGTTLYGGDGGCGDGGCGVVFELTPPTAPGGPWTETTLHTFGAVSGDGTQPMAPLTVGPAGVLYGTTYYGGTGVCYTSGGVLTSGCGTVFQLTPPSAPGAPWTYSVVYNFTGADGDGAAPVAGVVLGKNGAIYGTTSSAGSTASDSACPALYPGIAGCGIVFELAPPSTPGGAWTETILHSFSGASGDGAIPLAGLTLSSTGVLYGTTSAGGTAGKGTVFAVAP
jgi:hypothetical protein